MKIAVQFAGNLPRDLAEVWYKNVRKHMDCPIVHLTDMETEPLAFADEVQRVDEPDICAAKFTHLSMLRGNVLNLDYDTLVQRDVSDVFNKRFDVALTKRNWKDDTKKLLYLMSPHNTGVVFTRNPNFWADCLKRYRLYPPNKQWMVGQVCITEFANIYKNKYKVIEIPAALYNHTPKTRDEDVSNRYIVHYKGNKKHWMLDTQEIFMEGHRVGMMAIGKTEITPDHPNFDEIVIEQAKLDASRNVNHK